MCVCRHIVSVNVSDRLIRLQLHVRVSVFLSVRRRGHLCLCLCLHLCPFVYLCPNLRLSLPLPIVCSPVHSAVPVCMLSAEPTSLPVCCLIVCLSAV